LEVLERVSHIIPNLSQIHIQGIAEPFWKGLFFQILDVLKFDQHANQILVSTTTNGLLFTEEARKDYLRRVPNSITNFSIDAINPRTFQALRIFNENSFNRVMENLFGFDKMRDHNRQFLRIVTNVNTINIDEVKGIVNLAKQVRAVFVFGPTHGFNHKITVNSENCGRFLRAHYDLVDECKRLGVEYEVINRLDAGLANDAVFF
jgi:MoaA/NifB/PqqE/SkfB family radical SAM enzyme